MGNQPIGDLMELREMGQCHRLYLSCSETCLREIRRTFPAQRVNSVLFHLQVKQESIGTCAIAKGLQGSNVRTG